MEQFHIFAISYSVIESYSSSSLDRVTAPLHTCSKSPIISIDEILLLIDCLLILRRAILSRPASTGCGADNCTDGGSLSCITGNCANSRAP
jgi:hypothetical protein